jgi:hypothetical protein
VSLARHIATWLGRWPVALAGCFLLATAVLLPRLGGPGLWEPHERQLSDRVAPPLVRPTAATTVSDGKPGPPTAQPAPRPAPPEPAQAPGAGTPGAQDAAKNSCLRTAPADASARTLTARAIKWGRDTIGDSDGGRRLPLALFGLFTVLAAAGTAMRLAGARAGVVTAIVLLAMPLLTLQSRMLTSEIGTACGGSLIVYGLVALGYRRRGLAVPTVSIRVIDAVVAVIALAAIGLVGLLAHQLYDLKAPYPGLTPPPVREVLGKAIIPNGCYSWALGGIWRPEDDLRIIYDSTFEQIAYGTFPWGLLAPVAMAALLAGADPRHKLLGAVTLAWAGAAWVAAEVFQRKVGFTVYAGFPALAIAVGAWLDGVLAGRAQGDPDAMPPGAKLIALFALLGIVDLGKDMQSFAERLTSLLVGSDAVTYPTRSRLVFLPTKAWVLIIGGVVALGFSVAMSLWPRGDSPRERWYKRCATGSAIAAIGATIVLAAFWTSIWQPQLALHLSSKTMFETYEELARPGDELVIMGDLGQAPFAYTRKLPQTVPDRTQIIAALARPGRVFAIAPQTELCTLHREVAGKPYFVVDDRNQRSLLLSNRVDGTTDKNPLRTAIVHDEPKGIRVRPKGKVVWDNRIQLLGWDLPRTVARGARFDVTLYYKILSPVGGSWKTLMHFDGPSGRAGNGDHEPIGGRCPTSTWQPGDYIIDKFSTSAGGGAAPDGVYEVWLGFFTGAAPNWKNMAVSEAPGDMRDTADRVKITTLGLD